MESIEPIGQQPAKEIGGRIGRRLLIAILLFSTLLAIFATAIQLFTDYRRGVAEIDARVDQIERVHLSDISKSLFFSDNEKAYTRLQALRELPGIESLAILMPGKPLIRTGPIPGEGVFALEMPLVYRDSDGEHRLGVLRVVTDTGLIYGQLFDRLGVIIATNAAKTFLVAGFILFIVYRLITERLSIMAQCALDIDVELLDNPPPGKDGVSSPGGADELDEMMKTMLAMRKGLRASFHALREERDNLDRRVDERTAWLRSIVDTAVDGIVVIDSRGSIQEFSPSAERIFGYQKAEIMGRNIEMLIPELDRGRYDRSLSDYLNLGGSIALGRQREVSGWRRSGESFPMELSVAEAVIKDECFFTAGVRDITERKKAEVELLRSERLLAQAQQRAHLGCWEIDLINDRLNWSDEAFRIFEVDPDCFDASYEAFEAAIHPEDRDYVLNVYSDSVLNKIPYDIEHRLLMADGSIKYVHERGETEYDDQGNPLRSSGTVLDITERRLNEQKLEEAAVVFEVASEGILLTDAEGNIKRVNPAFSEITGYSADEVIGKNPRLLNSGYHDRTFFDQMWRTIDREGYWENEIWNRRKDGSIYPEWQMITRIEDGRGKVLGYVSQFSEITRRKLTEEEIRYRGNYDALTGLANRAQMIDRLDQAIKAHKRKDKSLALLYVDLDRFKHINDVMGYPSGDRLLQQIAERIQPLIREVDTAARVGGDEFMVMLTEQRDQVAARKIASLIVGALGNCFELDGQGIEIGASVGIAMFPDDGNSCETLFRRADLAMHRAKQAGGNQHQFYAESMEREFLERRQLESDLRLASTHKELSVHYQPIMDLGSGMPVGVESLLRWHHPRRGYVSSSEFIPVAEEIGLINGMGIWVLKTVCRQLAQWLARGLDLYASVNVSAHQIPDGLPLSALEEVVRKAGLNPDRIVIEITESVFVHDVEGVANWLHGVRKRGFRVYLDDFGTGYSSLAYLKQFPVDAVKIDQMFIREMTREGRDQALVRAVVAMSEGLDLNVVAEGIETEEQYALLRKLRCNFGQGYLFSRPLTKDQLPLFIEGFFKRQEGGRMLSNMEWIHSSHRNDFV